MDLMQASRIDHETGVKEVAEFVRSGDTEMFGFSHLPAACSGAGVVICSPLYAEFVRNYRREVVIARSLAASGIAVQRFHYRGHGNSEGDVAEATLQTMQDDAVAAAERLREEAAVTRLAFVGTRWGALVAAGASQRYPGSPLAFWDPVSEPSTYLREIFRVRRIQGLKLGRQDSDSAIDMMERLKREGSVDVLGYSVTRSLYEGSEGLTLEEEIGSDPRPLLVLKLGQGSPRQGGLLGLVTRWKELGFDAEVRSTGEQEPWWFTSGALVIREALNAPIDLTVQWLTRVLAERRGALT